MLSLIITLVIVGLAMYILEMFVPIDRRIKTVIYILIGLWILITLLGMAGVALPMLHNFR